MTQTLASFAAAVVVDVFIFLIAISLFNVLRRLSFFNKFYAPKRYVRAPGYARPVRLPDGWMLRWVKVIFAYTQEDIVKVAGHDAAMYLTIFSFGIKLFGVLSLWNLITVLPVNISGNNVNKLKRSVDANEEKYDLTNFDMLSMSNIEEGSMKLWVHLVSLYVTTIVTLVLLAKHHRRAVQKRIEYLNTTEFGAESHTVLVTDIPGVSFGTIAARARSSVIFRYLPKSWKKRIEQSLDTIFEMVAGGPKVDTLSRPSLPPEPALDHFPVLIPEGTSSSNGVDYVEAKSTLPGMSTGNLVYLDAMEVPFASTTNTVDAITDMNPTQWAKEQLENGLTVEELVEAQFKEVFSEEDVVCANVIKDTTNLEPSYNEYVATMSKLEDLIDEYDEKIKRRKMIKRRTTKICPLLLGKWAEEAYGKKPTSVDSLEFLQTKFENLEARIRGLQKKIQNKCSSSVFVTFRTRFCQVIAATSLFHHFQNYWHAEPAPHPNDILWENLKWRGWERSLRKFLVWICFALICLFFMIPIGIVQAMIEVDRLEKYKVIGPIVNFPIVKGILQAILPNIVLQLFLALMPSLLHYMNRKQGFFSLSSVDSETIRKYYIFQVITVFLFSFMSATLLNQAKLLLKDSSSIVQLLATSAPQTASFFIHYILVQSLVSKAFSFLRVPAFAIFCFLTKFSGSPRAKARLWQNQTILYGQSIPEHTLVILLGFVFSAVNPLVLPAALLYFVVTSLYWRYDLLYVYGPSYQSGGKLWVQVFDQVLVGLFTMHLMMIGLMGIKKFICTPLLLPLPLITIAFKVSMNSLYKRPLSVLSLRAAHDLDRHDNMVWDQNQGSVEETMARNRYTNPALRIDWEEHEKVLSEAKRINSLLANHDEPTPSNISSDKVNG